VTIRRDADHDAVCQATGRHILVTAPPGTGKTFLSVRLAGQLSLDLDAVERVLLVTFSNQARSQLEREAADQLTPHVRARVEVVNYHGFFRREVWANRRALGLPLETRIGTSRRRLEALAAVDREAVEQLRRQEGLLDSFAEQRFERFRDDRTPEEAVRERLLAVVTAQHRAGTLVFDDLGALFWTLLQSYPMLDAAYKQRYSVVIADEHQDASELQDSVVRRLAQKRLVIFADPMQLIYGFRGSKPERLKRHLEEADQKLELRTPHRWHGDDPCGRWLFAVRRRLLGEPDATPTPGSVVCLRTRYFNQMKARAKEQAASALRDGMRSVAVLAVLGQEVRDLRSYLSRSGLYPRQLGGSDDFEEAHEEIEQLPSLVEVGDIAHRALERVASLVPTLDKNTISSIKGRLRPRAIDLAGRLGAEARELLATLGSLYEHGACHYFSSVAAALDTCVARGHHLPRVEAVRAIRSAADGSSRAASLEVALARYSEHVATASQTAVRPSRGLYVMTVHQAKGKEFDAVVIFHASERTLPDTEESRRLFYVALTRASRRWRVIAPQDRASPLLRYLWP